MNEKVIIAVPIYDTEQQSQYTIQFIEQVKTHPGNWLLAIVDNGSTSPFTLDYLSFVADPRIHVIRFESNRGYGAAANAGIAWGFEQGAEYGIVLNNDIEFADPDWIENAFLKWLRENPQRLVGARYIPDNLGTDFGDGCIPYLEGYALGFHKDLWLALGGFDENFLAYYEDVDIAKRTTDAGYELFPSPAFQWVEAWGLKAGAFAGGAFIHFGGKTGYARPDFDFRAVTMESRNYFAKKFGY